MHKSLKLQKLQRSCINNLDEEERANCFALLVFLVPSDCCMALPHDATGLSAVCN